MANIPLQSITFPGLSDKYTTPTVDATLTQTGAAADAKKTGDDISELTNAFSSNALELIGTLERGAIDTNTGEKTESTNNYRFSTDIPVNGNSLIRYHIDSGYKMTIFWYDKNGTYISRSFWQTGETTSYIYSPANAKYMNVRFQTQPIATVAPESLNGHFYFYMYGYAHSVLEQTVVTQFERNQQASQGVNSGTTINVMSYNICNYSFDTDTFIDNEHLVALRKMLNDANCDYLMIQEDRETIDTAQTQDSNAYVFYPNYPYKYGTIGVTIHSKKPARTNENGTLPISGNRYLTYANYDIGDKKLLCISAHPTAGDTQTIARNTQYQEIFQWANGSIALNNVYAPAHDYCVIGSDTNSSTDTDFTNLVSKANASNFVLGNGGKVGWFITRPADKCIDNIMVTKNVIINTVSSLLNEYTNLYSDHVPVVGNLTLQGTDELEQIAGLKNDFTQLETDISILKTFHNISTMTLAQIHDIVQSGAASRWFNYGDQIELTYNDGTNDYTLPWDVVAFGNFELQNSDIKPGMVIQSHYAMQGVQFDASEAIYIAESAMPAGTYHFTIGTNWGTHCIAGKTYQFTTAQEIPAGGQIMVGRLDQIYTWGAPDSAPSTWRVHTFASNSATTPLETNLELTEGTGGTDIGTVASSTKYGTSGTNNLQRATYGYNRWSQSANRQFYNSNAAAGAWWTPQNPYDRAPEQLATVPGFMKGFDEEFLNIIKPVKVTTALNTVSDTDLGTSESTYDTFFLPSLEQEYIVPQLAGVEGDFWPYWKERLGLTSPQAQGTAGTNPRHIRYAYSAKTSAQYCRLRSAYRGYAYNTWGTAGTATYGYSAAVALRGCPACVII